MKQLQLKPLCLRLIPFFCVFCTVVFENLSFNLYGFSQSYLTNALGVVFYFTIFRVTAFNSIALFVFGIVSDILCIFPFGFSAFIYCFVFFIAQFNRPYLQKAPFKKQWLVYALTITGVFLFGIFVLKIFYGNIPHLLYLFIEYIGVMSFYPFIALLCGSVNRKMGG